MPIKEGDNVCLDCGGVNGHKPECPAQNDRVFKVISAYSRAQAIEDGVLVDCSQAPFDELNRELGIKVNVAMTSEAFHSCVYPLGGSFPVKPIQNGAQWALSLRADDLPAGQTMVGRYRDIVWMLRLAMQGQPDASCVFFMVRVVPNGGGNPKTVNLKCVAGPDDEGDICLTIMLPDQD